MDILSTEFLNTTYIDIIRQLSFYSCILGVVFVAFAIFAFVFKKGFIRDIISVICVVIGIIFTLLAFVDFMLIALIPGMYIASFLKLLMIEYVSKGNDIPFIIHIIFNFISLLISLSMYGVVIAAALENLNDNEVQTNE